MWPPPLSETPLEFEVKPRTEGKRLDVYLSNRFTDYSRRVIQKIIDADAVLVNGRVVKGLLPRPARRPGQHPASGSARHHAQARRHPDRGRL